VNVLTPDRRDAAPAPKAFRPVRMASWWSRLPDLQWPEPKKWRCAAGFSHVK